ncbi:serine hydrolase domain-containing protein [Marinicella meishanensis]|uniref:serine hydrolase domain-containing protein n=1 Tax=Marinicella meishanensis TaxID=2873263 RepID=UPI001CBC1944|nr:serine hydrolase domain-containing protein [Marinicella sp. NBU2979]
MKKRLIFLILVSMINTECCQAEVSAEFSITWMEKDEIEKAEYSNGVRSDSQFQVGSIAKLMCTVAIFELFEREESITLESSLSQLLPHIVTPAFDVVKLKHVLQNTSGLSDELVIQSKKNAELQNMSLSSSEAAGRFLNEDLLFAPGTRFDYNLTNWVLVQAILEHQFKDNITSILENTLFKPAKLKETTVFSGLVDHQNYISPMGSTRPIPDFVTCAGGVISSSRDLLRFSQFIVKNYPHVLFNSETIEQGSNLYAYGGRAKILTTNEWHQILISWQSGSNGSFRAFVGYEPNTGSGISVLTNDGDDALIEEVRSTWVNRLLMNRFEAN